MNNNNDSDIYYKNKKNKFFLIIGIVVIVLSGIFVYIKCFKTLYTLTYNNGGIPGITYVIKVYKYNDNVKVITTYGCSAVDCSPTIERTEKKTFNYSKDNIEKLKEFIDSNFSDKDIYVDDYWDVTEKQRDVIYGLIRGEHYFEVSIEEYN